MPSSNISVVKADVITFNFTPGSTDGPVTEIDPTLPFGTASTTLMPDMDGSTPMMPVEQTVPAGAEFTLDCDIPEGAQFDSWALVQGDNIILLDDGALDNMEVRTLRLFVSEFSFRFDCILG